MLGAGDEGLIGLVFCVRVSRRADAERAGGSEGGETAAEGFAVASALGPSDEGAGCVFFRTDWEGGSV